MRRWSVVLVVLFSALGGLAEDNSCQAPATAKTNPNDTPIPLCLVAKKVAATLAEYNSDPTTAQNALPHLLKGEFEFKTVTSNTVGFKFSILVFSVGSTHKSESTNDVTFLYQVPPPPPKKPSFSFHSYIEMLASRQKPPDFSKILIATLQNAAKEVKATKTFAGAPFKTLTISLAYGVTWDFSGDAKIPIQMVTIGPSIDHNRADTQTIKLTFEDQTSKTVFRAR